MTVQLHDRPSEPAPPTMPTPSSDPTAPPDFLQPHAADLLRYANHLLGRTPGAADVVQDTFARFWAQSDETRRRLCKPPAPPGSSATPGSPATPGTPAPLEHHPNGHAAPPDPHRRLRAWLFTVCRNRALDVRKKERRMTSLSAPQTDTRPHPSPGPARIAEQRDTHDAVLRHLATLPNNQQEVLRLKFQAELSYKQIAEVTGLTVSHVGVLLHHGLKQLRQDLTPGITPSAPGNTSGRAL